MTPFHISQPFRFDDRPARHAGRIYPVRLAPICPRMIHRAARLLVSIANRPAPLQTRLAYGQDQPLPASCRGAESRTEKRPPRSHLLPSSLPPPGPFAWRTLRDWLPCPTTLTIMRQPPVILHKRMPQVMKFSACASS
jgi:hypothetical protein